MATLDNSKPKSRNASSSQVKGSGSDRNSDVRRLDNEDNRLDKTNEDSFPASDAPSQSPRSGAGRTESEVPAGQPQDFKENKAAQFEYGRKSQAATQHFDTSENRLRKGNPDVGDVDLGTIEADKPAQRDDDDHYDSADDGSEKVSTKTSEMLEKSERKADINRQNVY